MARKLVNEKRGWRVGTGAQSLALKLQAPAALARRGWIRAVRAGAIAVPLLVVSTAGAQDCTALLSLFQQGLSTAEIAEMTGLTSNQVEACGQQLRQPIYVGPAGAPPVNAAGPPPRDPAGPPPFGAAGPPPVGAAGPPPVGRDVKRLP
jgi:hypothetical protein